MRTTVRCDDALMKEAKLFAMRSGSTLTRLIEDALREKMARSKENIELKGPRFELVTFGKKGTLPGVHLNNGAVLRDWMDE